MNNKKILTCTLLLIFGQISTAYCKYGSGFYLGGQVGGCNLHYEGTQLARSARSVNDSGFAGRIIAGFDINQNIGLEAGYTIYHNPEFSYRRVKTNFSQDSIDMLAKLSVPVSCNVNIYAKGGMAYVSRDNREDINDNVTVTTYEADKHLRPMLGVGITYGFNYRVSGDLGYFRTFGKDDLPDADFYGAGLTVRVG